LANLLFLAGGKKAIQPAAMVDIYRITGRKETDERTSEESS
jgi:hypothetical protein